MSRNKTGKQTSSHSIFMQPASDSPKPKVVVAYTSYPWDHAISTLRIAGPLQQADMNLIHGNVAADIYPERVSLGDLVLVQREFPGYYDKYEQIVSIARAEGKPIIYEIDDLLLEIPDEHPDSAIHYYTRALFPMLEAILEADVVTGSNPELCEYLRSLNPNTWLLPNYLDDSLWSFKLPSRHSNKTGLVIGYMGSDTHLPDLEYVSPVLQSILDRFGESIGFKFWGGHPPDVIRSHPNVEWIPLELPNYAEFASFFSQQECDIFIAPLIDSHFNRCKSPIKFLEYSSQGVPGVYSRVVPFESVVKHGENGFLASDLDEWGKYLVRLIENPDLRHQIAINAQETVRREWLLSDHAHEWLEVYEKALSPSHVKRIKDLGNRDVMIRALKQVYAWQREQDPDVNPKLLEKEREIAWLRAELDNIYNSNSWSFMQKMLKTRRFFVPEGSQREQVLKAILRRIT